MPTFHPFELEHYQSLYEHTVDVNLADSSVKCTDVGSWLLPEEREGLLSLDLFYPEVNGLESLRSKIAGLFPDTEPGQVLVTHGAAQANHLVASTLLDPGDALVWFSPGYRQIPGLAQNLGCRILDVPLDPDRSWAVDWEAFDAHMNDDVSVVAVVNPNNPTGSVLSEAEMQRIVAACERVGAWLHADEVYHGTELDGTETPTFRGMYDRVVVTGSLSKAYGLSGLRIGWAVGAQELIEDLWRRHEYEVIAAAAPSMYLADRALSGDHRADLLERQRRISREGHEVLDAWIAGQDGLFSVGPRRATSIGFIRYHVDAPSLEVAERIRKEASVLTAPGVFLGTEGHLRITVGYEAEKVRPALDRVAQVVRAMQ
jgi:aspartate/methionine/tyrosine aminotransferase